MSPSTFLSASASSKCMKKPQHPQGVMSFDKEIGCGSWDEECCYPNKRQLLSQAKCVITTDFHSYPSKRELLQDYQQLSKSLLWIGNSSPPQSSKMCNNNWGEGNKCVLCKLRYDSPTDPRKQKSFVLLLTLSQPPIHNLSIFYMDHNHQDIASILSVGGKRVCHGLTGAT